MKNMSKKEVLELLRELIQGASISYTDPDDYSGCHTEYVVDQEELLRKIEEKLSEFPKPWPRICDYCGISVKLKNALPPKPSYACPECFHLLGI